MQFIYLFFFLSLITLYSIFYKLSFTLKLDFEKIELQKKDISLISLKILAKHWNFWAKRHLPILARKFHFTLDFCYILF